MRSLLMRGVMSGTVLLALGCGDDAPPADEVEACEPATEKGCEAGLVCEEVEGQAPACFAAIKLRGRVFDTSTDAAIPDARVVARDANQAALSAVAITDANGSFELAVPAKRAAGGAVLESALTLRADAAGFLTFPYAPRSAIPIDLAEATDDALIESAATEIGLIRLPGTTDLGSISGRVLSARPGGTLVVAGGTAGGKTGIADVDGDYTIFNVPAGTWDVRGYAPGVNLEMETVAVTARSRVADVDLAVVSEASASVSGSVQIVNAPGGSLTSVILVVEDTFDELGMRGEAPPGLRAGEVSGAWSIAAVPDGRYVALAAFENDGLVRDPDTSIGGTEIVHVTVAGSDQTISQGFKVTGALATLAPGADGPEPVGASPRLEWEDDSSEDSYTLSVIDALGNLTWEQSDIMGPRGSAPVTLDYAGPSLQRGMYYQFRAVSIKDGVPITSTEDLKGVFVRE
jgi:hypothetical protein